MSKIESYRNQLQTTKLGKVEYDLWIPESRPTVLAMISAAFSTIGFTEEFIHEGYREPGQEPEVYRISAVALHKLLTDMLKPQNTLRYGEDQVSMVFEVAWDLIQNSDAEIAYP